MYAWHAGENKSENNRVLICCFWLIKAPVFNGVYSIEKMTCENAPAYYFQFWHSAMNWTCTTFWWTFVVSQKNLFSSQRFPAHELPNFELNFRIPITTPVTLPNIKTISIPILPAQTKLIQRFHEPPKIYQCGLKYFPPFCVRKI